MKLTVGLLIAKSTVAKTTTRHKVKLYHSFEVNGWLTVEFPASLLDQVIVPLIFTTPLCPGIHYPGRQGVHRFALFPF